MQKRTRRLLAIAVSAACFMTACTTPHPPQNAPTNTASRTAESPPATASPSPPASTAPETAAEAQPATAHAEAVVSSNTLATDAGARILGAGGSAADAAVAVAAVLTVVEPFYSSVLGGDTWALYYDSDSGDVTSLNAVGPVGSRATLEDYTPRAGRYGMHQAILPGAWDGWMLWLRDHGKLQLGQVLAPPPRSKSPAPGIRSARR